MLNNLSEYFFPEQEYYLENISYNRIECTAKGTDYSLTCTDNIGVGLSDSGVKVTLARVIEFDPNEIFNLSITFGAELKFKGEKKHEINWKDLNLAEEFRFNGDFVLSNLSSRISLLIAQITSSFGQQPLIIPGVISKN